MATRIQVRRDTAANWSSVNPVLAEGEIGCNLDTTQIKVGNGTDAWDDLPYTAGDGSLWTESSGVVAPASAGAKVQANAATEAGDPDLTLVTKGYLEALDITVSDTVPADAVQGQLWWNTDVGRMFIYYIDADATEQWVETTPSQDFLYWERTGTAVHPATNTDSVFVGASGGSGEIELNADGTSQFSGEMTFVDNTDTTTITLNNQTGAATFDGAAQALSLRSENPGVDAVDISAVAGQGGVINAGTGLVLGANSQNNIQCATDGASTFAGNVTVGTFDDTNRDTDGAQLTTSGQIYSQVRRGRPDTTPTFRVTRGIPEQGPPIETFRISADGSARVSSLSFSDVPAATEFDGITTLAPQLTYTITGNSGPASEFTDNGAATNDIGEVFTAPGEADGGPNPKNLTGGNTVSVAVRTPQYSTLASYEVGTWIPRLVNPPDDDWAIGLVNSSYIRIGNLCHVDLAISNITYGGRIPNRQFLITLPFPPIPPMSGFVFAPFSTLTVRPSSATDSLIDLPFGTQLSASAQVNFGAVLSFPYNSNTDPTTLGQMQFLTYNDLHDPTLEGDYDPLDPPAILPGGIAIAGTYFIDQ